MIKVTALFATEISKIVVDALVLFLTWAKTIPLWIEARRHDLRMTASTLLLRDGEIQPLFVGSDA